MHDVRYFHGLGSFYRRFIKNFSIIAAPLTKCIKKNVGFKWVRDQNEAFNLLKDKLCSAPLLSLLILLNLLKLSVMQVA